MTRLKRPKNEAWEKVTAEDLFELSFRQNKADFQIAELYGVKPEQVSYKRNKFNLKHAYDSVARRRLLCENGIDAIAISCGVDEEYRQKLKDLATKYFQKLMR